MKHRENMSARQRTTRRIKKHKNVVVILAVITFGLLYSTKSRTSWPNKAEKVWTTPLKIGVSEYIDLDNFASDLKNHWFLITATLKNEDVGGRRIDVIYEGYRVLQGQIADMIRLYAPGEMHNYGKVFRNKLRRIVELKFDQNDTGTASLASISSALTEMSSIVESVKMAKMVPRGIFKEINSLYRSVQSILLRRFDATLSRRQKVLDEMSKAVQEKFERLQNPADCSTARLQVCEVMDVCGYGCQLHWVTNCMMDALERNRTVVYQTKGWLYSEKQGWDYAFQPVGKCTLEGFLWKIPGWFGNTRIIRWYRHDRTQEVSYTIPTQLATSLLAVQGHPNAWWISQFISYLTKYQPWLREKIDKLAANFGFGLGPVTGVHIRRGDKLDVEASRFEVDKYMFFIEQWYLRYEATHKDHAGLRTVFVATDDSTVLPELKSKFPEYNFVKNQKNVTSYDEGGLESIVTDVHFLSRSDFVVCTFTSNVCRLVYEVMTSLDADASLRIQSLDDAYYFTNSGIPMRAVSQHSISISEGDLQFVAGDLLERQVNTFYQNQTGLLDREDFLSYNDGFFHGTNIRTSALGIFPTYKARRTFLSKNYTIFN